MIILPTEKRLDMNRAPFVLFGIILLNILIFVVYQSGDSQKINDALQQYQQERMLPFEWPLYEAWLERQGEQEHLAELQSAYESGFYAEVAFELLLDASFYQHLQVVAQSELHFDEYQQWSRARADIHRTVQSVSVLANGLTPNQLSLSSLITHQFLHGDLMHLLGNLFFLAVCGFAVEAIVGHWRFLGFYLLSGIAGGLAHAWLDLSSSQPLVGASGAISGVMAMYVAAFRLKRIEFFYWLYFLVGYIRAPALLILPFYIGKEVYFYLSDTESNVAFMAHAGGFIMGAALIGFTFLFNRNLLDADYIEADQTMDPRQVQLAAIYQSIEKFRFQQAFKQVNEMIRAEGLCFELARLRYNLLRLNPNASTPKAGLALLMLDQVNPAEVAIQARVLQEEPALLDTQSEEQRIKVAMRFSRHGAAAAAERLFVQLQEAGCKDPAMGVLAGKLAVAFGEQKENHKRSHYQGLSDQMLAQGL
ncbi:MAG: rhomboid family intramembrane serine protease [Saccharospirillum sp.]|nr:rhomboid family intramembrane serine protease [Saccharospirillum sp.]